MAKGTQHIIQLPGGPNASTAVPSPGGCAIYCKTVPVSISSSGGFGNQEMDFTFPVPQRSTINIQLVWSVLGGGSYGSSWHTTKDSGFALSILAPLPTGSSENRMMTTAITRNAGDRTIRMFLNSCAVGATGCLMAVAIVGGNTEDDCVTYSLGV